MIKVLIVEDDPMVAELNRGYVEEVEGFTFTGLVKNGEEALAFLEKNVVDLILLDVFMPNLDGMELLARIRTLGHKVDVIMVTAARSSENIEDALRQGVVDYLVKPFQFERLYASLVAYRKRRQIIAESDALDQLEIDSRILAKNNLSVKKELPKGLDGETLAMILDHVKQCQEPFTTEEMAGRVGISRVSLRKYLDFLKTWGVLQRRLIYRSVGRPVSMYSYKNKEIIF